MTDNFGKLLKILHQSELEMNTYELSDLCWLLLHRNQLIKKKISGKKKFPKESLFLDSSREKNNKTKTNSELLSHEETNTSPIEKQQNTGQLFPNSTENKLHLEGGNRSLPFKVDNANSLSNSLAIARVLKSLIRPTPALNRPGILDEVSTVENYAYTNKKIINPIFKPILEPWLELGLVVDGSTSMGIWHQTLKELINVFEHYGIFRNIQVCKLVSEGANLSLHKGLKISKSRIVNPRELLVSDGRRIIIVLSDCVAKYWHNGKAFKILKEWSNINPLAILQMMPEWLWEKTALRAGAKVTLVSNKPGVINSQLIIQDILLWKNVFFDKNRLKIPVFTLENKSLQQWIGVILGHNNIKIGGFIITPASIEKHQKFITNKQKNINYTNIKKLTLQERIQVEAEEKVTKFFNNSSPLAQELAILLASVPTIFLPVVRLIRSKLLPEAGPVEIAEVFLGGILKVRSEYNKVGDPDRVLYDFISPQIREILQRKSTRSITVDVYNYVSKYIAERIGLNLRELLVELRKPLTLEEINSDEDVIRPFAEVSVQILKTLGGEFKEFANEIQAYELGEDYLDYLYEAKLIIVGAGGAGKTTLANKIINPNYQLNPQEAPTEGINILQWSFPIEDKQGAKRDFRVNIWGFGGQEIYHTTHQFFLTKRSLYALVADRRKEDTDFPYWLNIVELLSDGSPLIIVKNEKDDLSISVNEMQLKREFLNLKAVLSCNLATNRGLDLITENIQHYLKQLPHIGDALPKTWKQIRDVLEKEQRHYISLYEYLKICDDNGFKSYEDQLQLSGYLHDLGVILHFQEDFILSQTVILKPEWGTYAVYKVLDNREVINNFGKFNNKDLRKIWKEKQYIGKQIELLQLMKRFQLCYQLPGTDDTYIAPQLLTQEQPSYDWNEANNLILRYTYEFMPKGIISQFIVAMSTLIENQNLVWRSGIILNKDRTRAEVIQYYDRRMITIRVSGENKKDLITIIRHELNVIHKYYKDILKFNEQIACNCSECKGQQDPYFYPLNILQRAKQKGQREVQCQKSFEMVHVLQLWD
ncbi:MAG: SAV_2336 N-terminal domain-related protein [Prochloraceae cyanobacterium]|nr:SAV_2336 N-terminal domain-related protein [Prochloraceae cyanobacterium]